MFTILFKIIQLIIYDLLFTPLTYTYTRVSYIFITKLYFILHMHVHFYNTMTGNKTFVKLTTAIVLSRVMFKPPNPKFIPFDYFYNNVPS